MPLAPTTRVGRYEIIAALGAGGMGEVYRARDAQIGRDVALKVLPEAFASDPERIVRFEREAQVLGSLNHQNIAAIYGIESGALVLELVEGPTLADLIATGPLPIPDALSIARQICDALKAAHARGIVHRDLKPANIKVRGDGSVKVLDFGLAKAIAGPPRDDSGSGETITSPAVVSRVGVIVGTAAYMSPEQARGKSIDERSDIWAFGCVLFEMLTGRRAFEGDGVTDTLSRVLQQAPDWAALPSRTPTTIHRLLLACLEKDPNKRLSPIAVAAFQLDEAMAAGSAATVGPAWTRRRSISVATMAALAGGAIAGAAIIWSVAPRSATPELPVTRLLMPLLPADQLGGNEGRPARTAIALSPDGRTVVFSAVQKNQRLLYKRALDQSAATPMPGTDGAVHPFFSPGGDWIGFFAAGEIKRIPLAGGPPVVVAATPTFFGASWGDDDVIVFARTGGGLWEVPAGGGTAMRRTETDTAAGEISHRLPFVLPGGDAVLYTVTHNRFPRWDETQVWLHSRRAGKPKLVLEGGADARYVSSGHLLYAKEGALLAVPFDLQRLDVSGNPVGIGTVMQAAYVAGQLADSGAMQASVSRNGTLAYIDGGVHPSPEYTVLQVDRSGRQRALPVPPQPFRTLRVSPDGTQLALGTVGRDRGTWLYNFERQALTKLAASGRSVGPVWTPDGQRITYASSAKGPDSLQWIRADGGGSAEPLVRSTSNLVPGSWSPGGRQLLYYAIGADAGGPPQSGPSIWWIDVSAKGEPVRLSPAAATAGSADVSPDGKWIAYHSTESGALQVYVEAFPGPGPRLQVSIDNGGAPVWRRDGRELFYVRATAPNQQPEAGEADVEIMSVTVAAGPTPTFGKPRPLFAGRYSMNAPARGYDVAPDGEHFIMMQLRKRPPDVITAVTVVQNWIEELKRTTP
jgi:serine/threonine-protein kinase